MSETSLRLMQNLRMRGCTGKHDMGAVFRPVFSGICLWLRPHTERAGGFPYAGEDHTFIRQPPKTLESRSATGTKAEFPKVNEQRERNAESGVFGGRHYRKVGLQEGGGQWRDTFVFQES